MLNEITIGIDISKDKIDVCILPDANNYIFENNISGFMALLEAVKDEKICKIIFEATGRYHRELEIFLHDKGLPFCKVNPAQAKHFGKALGRMAKTDKMDALMLAKMGVALSPEPRGYKGHTLEELRELLMAYRALTKDKIACDLRSQGCKSHLIKQQIEERLAQIKVHLKAVIEKMYELVMIDKVLCNRFEIICSIPGIGEITALNLIIDMPELGNMNPKQAASLAGLAPFTRQSGKWQGRAFIGGGRELLRRALYMPVLAACSMHNPVFKAKYQSMIANGKPAKVAITAIMRKLIVIINSMLKDNSKWMHKTS